MTNTTVIVCNYIRVLIHHDVTIRKTGPAAHGTRGTTGIKAIR